MVALYTAMKTPVTRASVRELPVSDNAPLPNEFLIFAPGDNPSTQGPALWDATAAAAVMKLAAERGQVEYPIDLEHRSLDKSAVALTTNATNAQGWFRLAVRNGALWAVNVRWTPEGEQRLRSRSQRYTSPAFFWLDQPLGRVGEIINVALVSMPATNDQAALVAASRTGGRARVPVNADTRAKAAVLLGRLGSKTSTVIHARVPLAVANELRARARAIGVSPGALLRALATEAKATKKDRARLLELLRLPATADDATIVATVNQLLSDTGEPPPAPDGGATQGNADAPPAPGITPRARLSHERFARLNPHLPKRKTK